MSAGRPVLSSASGAIESPAVFTTTTVSEPRITTAGATQAGEQVRFAAPLLPSSSPSQPLQPDIVPSAVIAISNAMSDA